MNLYYETEDNSLMHYGVPGMRWGHRKSKYITAYQAQKNATKAANEARKKSIAESRASGDKGVGSFARANRKALNAKRKAYGESITKDVAHNKQLRAENKSSIKDRMSARKARIEAADKAHQNSLNNYYKKSDVNYSIDKYNYGKKGVERISKRMDKGMSSFTAHQIEGGRQLAMAALNTVGLFAAIGGAGIVKDKITGR